MFFLKRSLAPLAKGTCEACPDGFFKAAAGHQWLECVDKNPAQCDANGADDQILTAYCSNIDDKNADCTCEAQPNCNAGELLGGGAPPSVLAAHPGQFR